MAEPASKQLALDFPVKPAFGREDFVISASNAVAVAALETWPAWQMPGIVLVGPMGAGKTHLANVFAGETGAQVLPLSQMSRGDDEAPLVLEYGQDVFEEAELFHLINRRKATGVPLLLTARAAPARWGVHLPDLASRLATFNVVEIGLPDDALITALFLKHFADRQLQVEPAVIDFLAKRTERSFDAVHDTVAQIDQLALNEGRAITIPLVRRALNF